MINKPIAIVIHHEGASNGFASVNEYHRQKWKFISSLGFYAGYHYYISLDGTVHQARAENEEGAHCLGGWNRKSVGICLQGDTNVSQPTEEQIEALNLLIKGVQEMWVIPDSEIYGHSDLWPTECPGKNLYKILTEEKKIAYLQVQINRIRSLIAELLKWSAILTNKK